MARSTIRRVWDVFSGFFYNRWGGAMWAALAVPELAIGIYRAKPNDIFLGIVSGAIAIRYFIQPPRRTVCSLRAMNLTSPSTTNDESNSSN